ncbi:hypothetical protein FAI40_04790 [Acetobacteraceae bacterium]|nr:hypothetical protein FAI40_04790 [Acetobacteraceae bacterium]
MGFLIALSVLLLILIGGLSTLAVSSFNSGKKSGREGEAEHERDNALAEAKTAQNLLNAQAQAPKTLDELQSQLEKGDF